CRRGLHRGAGNVRLPIRRRIDLSKPIINQNQRCKKGGDHRFLCGVFLNNIGISALSVKANASKCKVL
ncbi:hypothetical protein, partial [Rahnella sp. GSA61A]|uniref:hypothetical protein n=1 Tax=Rahnella sp. GSA61A TaxID=2862678 RepID=UPI001CBD0893